MTNHLATFKNEQTNMQSFVTSGEYGFHVSLKDLDSGEFIGLVRCFKDEAKALEYAKKLVP